MNVWDAVAFLAIDIACFALFFAGARFVNVLVMRLINSRHPAPVHQLLELSPPDIRTSHDRSFPTFDRVPAFDRIPAWARPNPTSSIWPWYIDWTISKEWARTVAVLPRCLLWLRRLFRKSLNARRIENASRLRGLRLRRDDNCLCAFSAFAVVTEFTSSANRRQSYFPRHLNFIIGYFSPLAFGFVLCGLTFITFAMHQPISDAYKTVIHGPSADSGNSKLNCALGLEARSTAIAEGFSGNASCNGDVNPTLTKFPAMLCVFIWFMHGIIYLYRTLRHDFSAIFRNYFESRTYPASMTRFVEERLASTPDLLDALESKWIPAAVSGLIVMLTSLYADFLQSL